MSMALESLFSQAENVFRTYENKEAKIENIKADFDKSLGINKEEHDKVVSLIEQFEDSEEALQQYDTEIKKTEDSLVSLEEAIKKLKDELSKGTLSPTEQAQKQSELNDNLSKLDSRQKKRKRLEQYREQEEIRNSSLKSKLSRNNVTDTSKAVNANKQMRKDISSSAKGGKMLEMFGKIRGIAKLIDPILKAIEWGIGKTTEYVKVFNENLMREMSASTTAAVNKMKAGVDSWKDAVEGAYSAQSLAVESQMAVLDATNANELASLKLANTWTNWIPIIGALNKAEETRMELEQQLQKMDVENAQKRISAFGEYVKLTDEYIKKQDKSVHQYQALNGLTVAQTRAFEKRMLANGETFAKFNKTIEDALNIQNSFAEQSGRSVNYSDSDFRKSFAVGRLVGEENLTQFQSMMNIFNTSISGSTDIMYDMYNYANKMGLSQQRLTKNILSNMKLANKYDFKNGSRGFIELAKWAENARMNLSSFGGAIEKVQSGGLEGVIKQAAGLQVLGGHASMNADPLAMMFEAGSDQQSYAKRIQDMLTGYGSFNKETGETTFSWNENQSLRAMAEQLNMPVEDLKDMARGARQKNYVKAQMGGSALSAENQDAVANKAQYDQQRKRWYVNTINGGRMDVADVTNENMKDILSNNKEENAEKYAQGTFSAVEKIEITTKAIASKLGAATFDDFIKTTETANQQTLEAFTTNLPSISNAISAYRSESLEKQKKMLEEMGTIDKSLNMAFDKVAAFEKYTEQRRKEMEAELDKIKKEKYNRQEKSVEELEEFKDKFKNTTEPFSKAWYAGRIKESTELIKSGDKRDSWSGIDEGWSGLKAAFSYFSNSLKSVIPSISSQIKNKDNINNKDYIKEADNTVEITKDRFKDGITSANGQPMAVSAANITPIHDGGVRIAKTDPQDSAVFAKIGGPFDKIVNGVFNRINEIYNLIGGDVLTNTNLIEAFTKNNSIANIIGGISSTNTKYGNTSQTSNIVNKFKTDNIRNEDPIQKMYEAFPPLQNQKMQWDKKLLVKVLENTQGTTDKDTMSMVEPIPMKKTSTTVKELWNNIQHDTLQNTTSSSLSFDKPIDINFHGEIVLKSENGQTFDISREFENNPLLLRSLSRMLAQQISSAMNGGRGTAQIGISNV